MLKNLQTRIQQYVNFQAFKLDLERAEEPEIKLPTSVESQKRQENSRKTSALLTTPKPLTVDHNKLRKILKEMGIPRHLACLLRSLSAGQEAIVRTEHGKTNCFQIGKGVCQGCILSPAYLTYMHSTSCEMPGWMKHKLESRLQGEISTTLDT